MSCHLNRLFGRPDKIRYFPKDTFEKSNTQVTRHLTLKLIVLSEKDVINMLACKVSDG